MKIEIFNVELGNCILITADTGRTLLIDCGHNGQTGWRPSTGFPRKGIHEIDLFIVSNYDNDHVSDLPDFLDNVRVRSLLRNKSVSSQDLLHLKSEKGVGAGIDRLADMMDTYTGGPLTIDWGGMTRRTFYNGYPNDFVDENNLSVVTFIHHGGLHAVFPGDLERPGWENLLRNPSFINELKTVNLFMASHHGRENGICEEVFDHCSPELVLISDAGIRHGTQYTASWYGNQASGVMINGQLRRVLTTRNDGKISIFSDGYGATVSTG